MNEPKVWDGSKISYADESIDYMKQKYEEYNPGVLQL